MLLTSLGSKPSRLARMQSEVTRRAATLQRHIVEHFAYEEATTFPQLVEMYSEFETRFQATMAQHRSVLEALEEFLVALNEDPTRMNPVAVIDKGIAFETVFVNHATQESRLLRQLVADELASSEFFVTPHSVVDATHSIPDESLKYHYPMLLPYERTIDSPAPVARCGSKRNPSHRDACDAYCQLERDVVMIGSVPETHP